MTGADEFLAEAEGLISWVSNTPRTVVELHKFRS